ncbi:MAG TPA: Fe-S cluster assembly protein SufD [Cytophagales bacterium]|nr:Fe-S cluster assembly protein SufD [Cytophagales bacterium]
MSTIALQDILNLESPYLTGDGLDELKKDGLASLKSLGFPSTKHEEWKYTNVTPLLKKSFKVEVASQVKREELNALFLNVEQAYRIVFINGKYSSEFSTIAQSDSFIIKPLSQALNEDQALVSQYIGKYVQVNNEAFSALNTSDITEGVFIHVPNNQIVEAPLYVYYITDATAASVFYQPRNLFVLGRSAVIKLVEVYRSLGGNPSFTNAITEVVAADNAQMEYYKIQDNQGESYQIETTEVYQTTDSVVTFFTATLGGALVRNNLHFRLDDKNCNGNMYGLYIAGADMHVDNHTIVDHLKPNSLSNELYKGVLGGNAKGVFNGKIFVRQDAQKTEAFQSNKNVLLSNSASMNTKPQLEIWADDVRCSHGATSGQLDDSALFYLRARGIGEGKAKAMLTKAFANDVLDKISIKGLKEELELIVEEKLNNI